jgi:alpha-L-rhamnosidase
MHPATGIIGSRYLYHQLCRYGYGDLAMAVLQQNTYPSYGWMIAQGATTFWETWEKNPEDEPNPRSRNHPMQAAFAAWFHEGLGGLTPQAENAAFGHFSISPQMVPGLDWVTLRHESIRGPIEVAWSKTSGGYRLEVDVPPNSTARVIPPKGMETDRSGCTKTDGQELALLPSGKWRLFVGAKE